MALYFKEEAQWEQAMRLAFRSSSCSVSDGLWAVSAGDAEDLLSDAGEGVADDLDSESLCLLWGCMVDEDHARGVPAAAPPKAGKPAYGSDLKWLAGSDRSEQLHEHTAPFVLSQIAARQRCEDFAAEASEASTLESCSSSWSGASSGASSPTSSPDSEGLCVPGLNGHRKISKKKAAGSAGKDRIKRRAVSKDFKHLAIAATIRTEQE
jgi:hypothetical protein